MKPDAHPTRTHAPDLATGSFDALDAGLAAAFGADLTPGGWSQPPLLRDDPSDGAPLVQPSSPEMPRGSDDRYQLLGEIARGGMGVVLKGRDPDLGRDLAFKVLRAELARRPGAVQRFVEEAQVGGQLQHPGVVPVYDIGRFADGRPYFAMKLVKGRTLADLLAERDSPSSDRGQFLQHFLQVCQTIAYAHSKGVIHRDLKPSNVMVGGFGEVLVMDWGLAKVLPKGGVADELKASRAGSRPTEEGPTEIKTARFGSGGSETQAGSVMGTPAFMPPEQAGGEIDKLDERADVFGLGAILCVILTGEPPYVADSSDALRLMAVRGDLDEAISRLKVCGSDADLVALCLRCLSAKRESRPRHAGALSVELGTYLASVEQRAHDAEIERAEAAAEVKEQRKRRKVQLALAASIGLLLLGGGAFGWWQDRQAATRREQLARDAEAVAALLDRCEESLRNDDAATAALILEQAAKRATDGGTDDLAARLDRCRADLEVLRDMDAADQYQFTPAGIRAFETEWIASGSWVADENEKEVVNRIRAAFGRLGVMPGETAADEAAARVRDSVVRDRLVTALDRWLRAERLEKVRSLLRVVDPDSYRNAVRDAVLAKDGARVVELAGRTETLLQPPGFAAFLGKDDAIPAERRRTLLQAALRRQPGNLSLLMALAGTSRYDQREGAEDRVRWLQAAVAAHPSNAASHGALGVALGTMGDREGAIAEFKETIRLDPKEVFAHLNLSDSLRATNPDAAIAEAREAIRLRPNFAGAHRYLGNALAAKRDFTGAAEAFREAIRLDPNSAWAHYNLGHALFAHQDFKGAAAAYSEGIRFDPKIPGAHNNLGLALLAQGDVDGAIARHREAIRLDPKLPGFHRNLGVALRRKGDPTGALEPLRKAVDYGPKVANFRFELGISLRDAGDLAGAETEFREMVNLSPKDPSAHANLGWVQYLQKRHAEAAANYREAVKVGPTIAKLWWELATILREGGDATGAVEAAREAIRLEPMNALAHLNLARALSAQKNPNGAIACYREIIRLNPKDALAHLELGNELQEKGDQAGAVATYADSIRLFPQFNPAHERLWKLLRHTSDPDGALARFAEAVRHHPKPATALGNLGVRLYRDGDLDAAIAADREAIRLDPTNATLHNNLAFVLQSKEDLDGAISAFHESIRLNPKYVAPRIALAFTLMRRGERPEAVAMFNELIALGSTNDAFLNNLAMRLASGRDGDRDAKLAVDYATRACEMSAWKEGIYIDTLAVAYAEAGDYDKAIEYQKRAMRFSELEKQYGNEFRERLALFQQKKPFRAPEFHSAAAPPPREVKR